MTSLFMRQISGAATVGVGKTSQYTLDTNAEGDTCLERK